MLDFYDSLFLADDVDPEYGDYYEDDTYFQDLSQFETVLDPSAFPTYDPEQTMIDPTFFEYDSRGVIDVAATEENQAKFKELFTDYEKGEIGFNTYARQISELQQKAGSPVTFMNIGDPSKNLKALAKFMSGAGSAAQAQKMGAFGYDKPGPARGISGVPTAKGRSLANIAMEGIRSTGGDFGVNVKANQVAVRQTVDSPQIASRRGSTKATPGNIGSQVQKRGFDRYIRGLA